MVYLKAVRIPTGLCKERTEQWALLLNGLPKVNVTSVILINSENPVTGSSIRTQAGSSIARHVSSDKQRSTSKYLATIPVICKRPRPLPDRHGAGRSAMPKRLPSVPSRSGCTSMDDPHMAICVYYKVLQAASRLLVTD